MTDQVHTAPPHKGHLRAEEADGVAPKSDSSLLNDVAFRGFAYQILLAAGIAVLAYFLYTNVVANLDRQRIATGFAFLWEAAGFDIGESVVPYDSEDSYGRALWIGVLNTLTVSACGIVLASILGVTMGIARVSRNWLASKLASAYVEATRNVPVVLHVIFWGAVIRNLPQPRQALVPFEGVILSNRGLTIAVPVANSTYYWVGVAFIIGLVGAFVFSWWAERRRERTGIYIAKLWPVLGLVAGLPLATWLAFGAPLAWDFPVFKAFNFRGGSALSPEFIALLVGITVYTGAFIAEIVRAGIQSVSRGQVEAAKAIGLRPRFIMRYVIFPQALRVIIPPTTSQYLSLTKNSSLGVLIGYPDLVNVGNTTLNQTGQAVEAITIMMIVYLTISLTISFTMNIYNRYVEIKER